MQRQSAMRYYIKPHSKNEKGHTMAITQVREYLAQYGYADKIQEFAVSSATVELAAQALHTEGARIAKTLSFIQDGTPVLIVTAGDTKIDNKKYKALFGTKAKMISHDEVEPLIGHQVGGVCPFAVQDGVRVYLDISLKRFQTVFPACGSSSSAIELTPQELEYLSHSSGWIDVSQPAA